MYRIHVKIIPMRELIIATQNPGKLREIRQLCTDIDLKITSLADYPQFPDIVEDGDSFHSNAVKKALTISARTSKLVMGEDSGLEVEALNNQPGIYSARFSGEGATDEKNNAKLLQLLQGVPPVKRRARYRCFIALAQNGKVIDVVNGSCCGVITEQLLGSNGFGYDPLFLIPRYQKTFGQLPSEIKAKVSHRSRALKKLRKVLQNFLINKKS